LPTISKGKQSLPLMSYAYRRSAAECTIG